MSKPPSADDFKRRDDFELLRKTLSDEKYTEWLGKPLAYWALPNDRGLPFAFLERPVRELLAVPYEQLASTPGIGPKKLVSFLKLLERIVANAPVLKPTVIVGNAAGPQSVVSAPPDASKKFDPSSVSETQWLEWCEKIARYNVGREKVGRLVPSLQSIPSVLWNKPLKFYMQYSLSEIRKLKTHGVKRVNAVLTLFHEVSKILSAFESQEIMPTRLIPRRILNVEMWIANVLAAENVPNKGGMVEHLAMPLMDQVNIDAGSTHRKLVEGQLGIGGGKATIREHSRRLGMTRPRVYQLLEDCKKIFIVRWPEASSHLNDLLTHCADHHADDDCVSLIQSIRGLIC